MAATPFSVSTATISSNGGYSYNQDRVVAITTPDIITLAVADGHGSQPAGELFAEWTTNIITEQPATTPFVDLFAHIEATCHEKFRHHHKHSRIEEGGAFYSPRTLAPHRGGTTLSVVRINTATGVITAANVGDSDVRYFDFEVASAPSDPDAMVLESAEAEAPPAVKCLDTEGTAVTADHSPSNIAEYHRAMSETQAGLPPPTFSYDVPSSHCRPGTPIRPVFIPKGGAGAGDVCLNPAGGYAHATIRGEWGAYIATGDRAERLAMTRSIGDFHLKRYGVSATPSVSPDIQQPPGIIRVVVAASDGLWDGCHYHEVAEVIGKHLLVADTDTIVKELLHLAEECSTERFGGLHDNISIAVAVIRPGHAL